MIEFKERIPVDPDYAKNLGYVLYNYATSAWMVVYLGSLLDHSFLDQNSRRSFEEIASLFTTLSETANRSEFIALAQRFSTLTASRTEIERAIPITAYGGVQEFDASKNGLDDQWPADKVMQFADDLQNFDIDANALYYKLKKD